MLFQYVTSSLVHMEKNTDDLMPQGPSTSAEAVYRRSSSPSSAPPPFKLRAPPKSVSPLAFKWISEGCRDFSLCIVHNDLDSLA